MKIAMVGYGKMGKMIETLAPEHGGEVALRRLEEFFTDVDPEVFE